MSISLLVIQPPLLVRCRTYFEIADACAVAGITKPLRLLTVASQTWRSTIERTLDLLEAWVAAFSAMLSQAERKEENAATRRQRL
jgi:hypothetical protein